MTDQPLSAEQYRAHLDRIDGLIQRSEPYRDRYGIGEDASAIVGAINDLTEATRAVAMGLRLLAEPPPTTVATRGTFTVIDDEEQDRP